MRNPHMVFSKERLLEDSGWTEAEVKALADVLAEVKHETKPAEIDLRVASIIAARRWEGAK